MPRHDTAPSFRIYTVKIGLAGSKPPIWRRCTIPGEFSLADLHHVIQVLFGWDDDHLHSFYVGRRIFGARGESWDSSEEDESLVRIQDILKKPKDKTEYVYDFGDNWSHLIEVESVETSPTPTLVPTCLAGRRAAPPEDCGGIWGYHSMLKALKSGSGPEYEDAIEWTGNHVDPERFDVEVVNKSLRKTFGKRNRA